MNGWVIQLGATDDEDKAKAMLDSARGRFGNVLGKASPFTEKVTVDGTTLYRARFSGFSESNDAANACKLLKKGGMNCFASQADLWPEAFATARVFVPSQRKKTNRIARGVSAMSAQQDFSRLVHASREIRRPSLVGMEFLHQRPVRFADLVEARARLKPQDLIGFLFRHYARMRLVRVRVSRSP